LPEPVLLEVSVPQLALGFGHSWFENAYIDCKRIS
jgi:hypothetical protein